MQEDVKQTATGVYIVRDGEGEDARYAICTCIDVQSGNYILPGTNETLASLVDRQGLRAAHVLSPEGLQTLGWDEIEFDPQSGFRAKVIYKG